jgi:hypothetical protein
VILQTESVILNQVAKSELSRITFLKNCDLKTQIFCIFKLQLKVFFFLMLNCDFKYQIVSDFAKRLTTF